MYSLIYPIRALAQIDVFAAEQPGADEAAQIGHRQTCGVNRHAGVDPARGGHQR